MRPMQARDLRAVMAIESRSYDFPWTEAIFRDCLRVGYYCQVLESDGGVAGYGILSLGAGEAHILNLCIKPDLRGQGLGRRMLGHLLSYARRHHATAAVLEVRRSNHPAQELYKKTGFEQTGVRKNYYPAYGGREDALVFINRMGNKDTPSAATQAVSPGGN